MIYTTTQTHSLGAKAALILGLRERSLSVLPEDNYGLRGATLKQALEEDQKEGYHPFILSTFFELPAGLIGSGLFKLRFIECCIVATVGTTSSGAIDYLPEIFEVCE